MSNSKKTNKVKTLTVIEREYDSEGNLVKEIETITEYDTESKYFETPLPSPYPEPPYKWNPFDRVIATY